MEEPTSVQPQKQDLPPRDSWKAGLAAWAAPARPKLRTASTRKSKRWAVEKGGGWGVRGGTMINVLDSYIRAHRCNRASGSTPPAKRESASLREVSLCWLARTTMAARDGRRIALCEICSRTTTYHIPSSSMAVV